MHEKVLSISTISVLIYLVNRSETHGPWIGIKKPNLLSMPVLDVTRLDDKQLKILADTYDEISKEPLLPISQMENDPIRIKIDSAISEALKLPDLDVYRMLLAQEPIISNVALKKNNNH